MTPDVALNKKESIERYIRQIRKYYSAASDLPFETDFMKQDAIAANLQRAAEQTIDLANHLIRKGKLGLPKDSRDSFAILAAAKVISDELARKLKGMIGFRNVLVHDYCELNLNDALAYLKNLI
jgi:uncharacterized protein YutE (UPF0331/DUF86 family)